MPVMSPFMVFCTTLVVDGATSTSMWCGKAIMSRGPDPSVCQSKVMVPRSPVAVADTVPPVGMRAAWASSVASLLASNRAARSEPVNGAEATSPPLFRLRVIEDEA